MSICNEIVELQRRATAELDKVYHFRVHTALAYKLANDWISKNCKEKFQARVPHTNTTVNGSQFTQLLDEYDSSYVLRLGLQHLVTVVESFLFDLMRMILRAHPEHLSKDKKFAVSRIVRAKTIESLLQDVIDDQLGSLRYESVGEWFRYYESLLNIAYPDKATISRIVEIKASRDLLVHNDGVINEIYLSKTGSSARGQIGELIPIDQKYFHDSWELLRQVVAEVATRSEARFARKPDSSAP